MEMVGRHCIAFKITFSWRSIKPWYFLIDIQILHACCYSIHSDQSMRFFSGSLHRSKLVTCAASPIWNNPILSKSSFPATRQGAAGEWRRAVINQGLASRETQWPSLSVSYMHLHGQIQLLENNTRKDKTREGWVGGRNREWKYGILQ